MNAPEKDRERVRDVLTLLAGDLALTPALYLPSFPALSLSFPICIMVTRRAAWLEGPASCNVLSRVRKRSPGEEQEGGLSLSHTDRLRLVQPAWMGVCPAHARAPRAASSAQAAPNGPKSRAAFGARQVSVSVRPLARPVSALAVWGHGLRR